jgi:hypothetical protein
MSDVADGSSEMIHADGQASVDGESDDHAGAVLMTMLTAIVLLVCAVVVFGYAAIIIYALAATAASLVTLVILTAGR